MGVGIPKISCLHHYGWDSLKRWAGFPSLAAESGPPMSPAQHQGYSHSVQPSSHPIPCTGAMNSTPGAVLESSPSTGPAALLCCLPKQLAVGRAGTAAVRWGDEEDEVPFGTAIVLPELDCVLSKESAGECFAVVCSPSHPGKISHRTEQVHYVPCLLI